jgi:hypothetical protein
MVVLGKKIILTISLLVTLLLREHHNHNALRRQHMFTIKSGKAEIAAASDPSKINLLG